MTVQSATSRVDYDGNGVTVDFAVTFRFLENSHLRVIRTVIATGVETDLVLDSAGADGFTVTGAGSASGGEVTVVTPPVGAGATQERITILRNVPATQLLDFIANDAFPAESHERVLDQLTMLHQQQGEQLDRAITVPVSSEGFSTQLPTPVAGAPLVVSAAGDAIEMGSTLGTGDLLLRGDLASSASGKGGALVKYKRTDTGAVDQSVLSRLLALPRTPQEFNATANGVADDTAEVNAALAAARDVELEGDYLVTSITNPLGSEFKGGGRVLKSVTGGHQQLNSKADISQHIFGVEYLAAFQAILDNKQDPATILMSGDSTTAGDGATTPRRIWEIVNIAGVERGHEVTVTNGGHSGKHTGEWVSDYLTADLATNPNLYVVRWGINDPFAGRTIDEFATSLRAGLAQCRASKTLAQMSILLMSPNSTSDTPNDRDERWYEQARLVCRQAARDYYCCFIDTYALLKDSRPAANVYMDDPFGDGRAIHPKNVMNVTIGSIIADTIFPSMLRPRLFHSSYGTLLFATAPDRYAYGQTVYSAASGSSDFLVTNPTVVTVRSADGGVYQRAFSNYDSGANNGNYPVPQLMERMGLNGTWYTPGTAPSLDLTSLLVNGWVPFDATTNIPRAKKTNNHVTLSGLIKSGTTAATTVLFTLPAGYRPRNSVAVFLCAMGPTGTTTPCAVHVTSAGVVTLQSVGNAAFVSLDEISFEVGG